MGLIHFCVTRTPQEMLFERKRSLHFTILRTIESYLWLTLLTIDDPKISDAPVALAQLADENNTISDANAIREDGYSKVKERCRRVQNTAWQDLNDRCSSV